jgi:hypothetical protein
VRRAEIPKQLPPDWRPREDVVEQIRACNLDPDKVLAAFRAAKEGVKLRRWRDDTFLHWFDEALEERALAEATPIRGMPVLPDGRWKAGRS